MEVANYGNAYLNGRFTVPISGIYFINFWSEMTGAEQVFMILTHDNSETTIARTYHNDGNHNMNTITQIIHLDKGDKIQLKLSTGNLRGSTAYASNGFMGYLIYPDK